MSMQPPYQPPDQLPYGQQPYAVPNYYNGPTASIRPGVVTGVAITGIVLGGIGVLCSGSGVVLNVAALGNGGRVMFAPNLPPFGHSLLAFSVFQCVLNTLVSVVLLIGSIGALSLKPWARAILMPWAAFAIVWSIVLGVVAVAWMNPATSQAIHRSVPGNSAFLAGQDMGRNVGSIGASVLFCVLPILILALWNRPHVKAAFGVGPALPAPLHAPPPGYGTPPTYPGNPYGRQ